MAARFGDYYEWLTITPLQATYENKKLVTDLIKIKRESMGGIEISPLLKAIFEMDFEIPYARSVIIISNGNLKEQGVLERLLTTSRNLKDTRVSAVGIGSGCSDSFLRIIASKGLGLIECLTSHTILESRCKMFMVRLRAKTVSNIQFEFDETAIVQVLPICSPNQSILKSSAIEVFIYLKDKVNLQGKKQAVIMHYFDEEDQSNKSLTIFIEDKFTSKQEEMHKVCINELLLSYDELKLVGQDKRLCMSWGNNWHINLAV